jgi:FdrA protein
MTNPNKLFSIAFIHNNLYKDSVALMRVAQRLLAMTDVVNATLQMGNPANKEILQEAGLLVDALKDAGPSDIMVVVQARTQAACESAIAESKSDLAGHSTSNHTLQGIAQDALVPRTIGMGLAVHNSANIAQISVPGAYAAAEALKAIKQGLHVFMFSDNVPLEQEIAIKKEALRHHVLVMGPDCGTAIVDGVPLGFANNVRRGSIGIVAASGTGLQEVSTQIHRMGGGISHAIGTGGRDVYADVGGITMLQGIALLAADAATKVIAIVSKPPSPTVMEKVMSALVATGKPAVVVFLGSHFNSPVKHIQIAKTLVDCAALAVKATGTKASKSRNYLIPKAPKFNASQQYLRALYSGGTYAAEAQVLWAQLGLKVWSNVPICQDMALKYPLKSSNEHTVLDLGDDDFTVGRPHPMIDQTARIDRLLKEAADPSVRVIVLDVVIGWGAHTDPATELGNAILKAKKLASKNNRNLAVIGFVCGTELDPQVLEKQEAILQAAGMVLAGNSANAAWLAAQWLK